MNLQTRLTAPYAIAAIVILASANALLMVSRLSHPPQPESFNDFFAGPDRVDDERGTSFND